jgi:ubiquinone/menaquinone biosynthesis C-methylase UbiE
LQGQHNLDLGCGSYSYLDSVGFDLSPKMLDFNGNLSRKVIGDVEKKLPFKDQEFDSVTAIFLLNYVQNYSSLLKEVARVLKEKGHFVMVLSSKPINDWQRQKEVSSLSSSAWSTELKKSRFKVKFEVKDKLYFFKCRKLY